MLVFAERMRNAGKYTMADLLAYRLNLRPARAAAALGTLAVTCVYLITQLVGAGSVVGALMGLDPTLGIVISGIIMLIYVAIGGMLATTWVLIIKAALMMLVTLFIAILVLIEAGFDLSGLASDASEASGAGGAYLTPGLAFGGFDRISLCLALTLGSLGLPHMLMRFMTVPDKKAARVSMGFSILIVGFFFLLLPIIGMGARAFLSPEAVQASGGGGNLAVAQLALFLGGGEGTVGGDLLLAVVASTAFVVIVGFVAGVVLAAAGAVAHDVWTGVVRHGQLRRENEEITVARFATLGLAIIGVLVAILAKNINLAFLGGLAVAIAASANFPPLLLAMTWKRFNTAGAVVGVLTGVISAVVIIIMTPPVWPGPDSEGAPLSFTQPGLISIPLGFLGCYLGTVLSREKPSEVTYEELRVRAETGLGAEGVPEAAVVGREPALAGAEKP
jgi:cation/acetate symporter